MSKILVSGLINIETNVNAHKFPVEYSPIEYAFNCVDSSVSGVAYNVICALNSLGDTVMPASLIGNDIYKDVIISELKKRKINTEYIKQLLSKTCTSVNLFDDSGVRKIFCDLKDIQEKIYPLKDLESVISGCSGLVICNINFNGEIIENARRYGKPVFCDVHVLSDIHDSYNARFMQNADVLFLSDEGISGRHEDFLLSIYNEYRNKVIVLGQGASGAMILDGSTHKICCVQSVHVRPVVNTCGAGDSLFSAFVHYYLQGLEGLECLKYAVTFASYKIGESGGAEGFIDEKGLKKLYDGLEYKVFHVKDF